MKIPIKNNIYVQLDKASLRGFTLSTNSKNILYTEGEHYEITSLIIEDSYTIKLGDVVVLEDNEYTVNKIKKAGNKYNIFQSTPTKTSLFIMPVLDHMYEYYDFSEHFYNSYLSDDYHHIYLVYKFSSSESYLHLEDKLMKHIYFEKMLDPSPDTVVFKFRIPEMYWRDMDLIMEGKYSKISASLKSKIIMFHGVISTSKTFKALYNDKKLREEMSEEYGVDIPEDVELFSIPELKEELWTFQNILKKSGIAN